MAGDDVKEENVQAVKHLRAVPSPPQELELLFREHHDHVFRAAYRVTGNPVDAEDVLQTVFLRLARRKEKLDLSPSPGSYLHRAAVNASLDLLRSRTRSRSVSFEEVEPFSIEGSEPSPETQYVDRELQNQIRRSISTLGPKAAEIIVLKYFEGHSNLEIAEMLGTSQMVIGVLLHRARTRLRKEIATFLEGHHEADQ
ncbi:MAG TPA: sigma-70 family RNA polymerase sigma factor [Blastocatellia bacterium]|nr:sigma-70 family RNA polymerase sigma factor [Blastocatellia bacterium]